MYEKNLDYFRGLFAVLVVFAHTYQILLLPLVYDEDSILLKIVQFIAAYAVIGFILISGYSIASSLHFNYLVNNKKIDIIFFVRKRIYRILPPFLLSLFIMIFLVFIIQYFSLNGSEAYRLEDSKYVPREKAIYDWNLIFCNLLFLPKVIYNINTPTMNGPLWSLNFEVYFYLLFASMVLLIINLRNKGKKFLILILISIITLILFFQFFYNHYINVQFLYLFMIFSVGALSFYFKYYKFLNKLLIKIFLSVLLLIIIFIFIYKIELFLPYLGVNNYNIMVLFSIILVLFYSLFLSNKNLYGSEFFLSVSKYSYTLYIIHFPLLLFFLSLFHKKIYTFDILELIILLVCINFCIFKFCKISSYVVERKNYK